MNALEQLSAQRLLTLSVLIPLAECSDQCFHRLCFSSAKVRVQGTKNAFASRGAPRLPFSEPGLLYLISYYLTMK